MTPAPTLGFLTILPENGGYVGGYLVTNAWGRPLEFRISTAVQPNRVQQILYGGTLQRYICGELISKALLDKADTATQAIFTDREPVLDVRLHVNVPVVWLAPTHDPVAQGLTESDACVQSADEQNGPVLCHPRFPEDAAIVRQLLASVDQAFVLTEPFTRIRDAVSEARKQGVTSRG